MTLRLALLALVPGAFLARGSLFCQVLPPPLTPAETQEVRQIVDAMKASDRGPYSAIRWYCQDGSVLPAQGTPCRERGGGVQHGELSPQALRLASLQIHVGTILQGVPPDSLIDSAHGNQWLKELILGQYLSEVDDGWVLRGARYYRGARQIEDEEARGEEVLGLLLSDPDWTRRNFLLAVRLVAALPHPGTGIESRTQRVRNLATEIAEMDPGFLRIRIKIHSVPSRADLGAVERYLARPGVAGELRSKLDTLQVELSRQYDPFQGRQALARYAQTLGPEVAPGLAAVSESMDRGGSREAVGRMAELSATLRRTVESSSDGARNLVRMDLIRLLQEQAFLLAQDLRAGERGPESRLARIRWLSRYYDLAFSAGFISGREREALGEEVRRLSEATELSALEYRDGVRYLAKSLEWSWGRVRSVFGLVHQRYLAFEPMAQGFLDSELRGSALLHLSGDLTFLAADADQVLGASHLVLGEAVVGGVRGLNPGLARGNLDFMEPGEEDVDASRIYVLPVTLPELKPVAGVLTLEEGNLLSHVQLLARNLGIPNASVSPDLDSRLRSVRGEEVFYAVSPLGRVILERMEGLGAVEAGLLEGGEAAPIQRVSLDTNRLRLDRTEPLPLEELRADASGVFVGPKAANLGQLAYYFPGQVAPGVALPFGMFYRHADRAFESDRTLLEDLREAYAEADRMRGRGTGESEVDAYMFQALERTRRGILELDWQPEVLDAIREAVKETFGDDLDRGVFVRSDTNVEDLPQFSGAGLNLTVPHRRNFEDILVAVRQVWTSPFSERAYLWRKQILAEQDQVYPSVLLLASVPSEKSGVLITTGLEWGGPEALTVVTAEGVGGGVEGEEAETIVVDPVLGERLLTQAKAPRRRVLRNEEAGGVDWRASATPDTLLQAGELDQLLEAANRWKKRFAPGDPSAIWDMEFGFVNGRLWLFQIRPFVKARDTYLLDRLGVLDQEALRNGARPVSLLEAI